MDVLQGVLDASPDAVLVVDEAGVIQRANRHVLAVLGYQSREIEGLVVEDLLLEADRDHHVEYRRAYMADPEPRPMGQALDLYALRKDGTQVPVEISLGPIEREGETNVVATVVDVSDRKQREQELARQNERLEEFASIVSHDLRNPLNVAVGRLELLKDECDSEQLDVLERSLDRMTSLIEDLLRLARAGEGATSVESVDLALTIQAAWKTVPTEAASLVVDVAGPIRADPGLCQQLVENLLRNAVVHGGESVTVTVGDLDDGFFVADDGRGVPADDRQAVFTRGYTTSSDGTGYGLTIVDQIAEAHGWTIRLIEGSEGGARFDITGVDRPDA